MTTDTALNPPPPVVDLAASFSLFSPCRSKRGAVIFRPDGFVISQGYNFKPRGFACDGTETCKSTCRIEAVHAEQMALLLAGARAAECDILHVKTHDGRLAPSGEPSCVECSKLLLAAGVNGVWLFHVDGWRRYAMTDFHRISLSER